jgi:hypothetical protein
MAETDLQDDERDDIENNDDPSDQRETDDNQESDEDPEVEARARRQGWVPESEWDDVRAEAEGRRKPARFVTPQEYLDRIESNAPMMRAELRKSDQERAELRKQLDEVASVIKWQAKQAKTQREKAYEQGIKDAEARMLQAVTEADTEAFETAKADHERLVEEAKSDDAPQFDTDDPPADEGKKGKKGKTDPETQAWLDKNPWFNKDPELNASMIKRHQKVLNEMPGLSITESLDEAKRRVVERFPDEFGINPRRKAPGAVSHPSGDRGNRNSSVQQRFNALPAEDKAIYAKHKEMFAAKDAEYTVEEFMEGYYE